MTFQGILKKNSKHGYWKAALAFCYEENTTTAQLYNLRRVRRFRRDFVSVGKSAEKTSIEKLK